MAKFNFKDEKDFEKVSADAEAFYTTIGEVRCPYFGEKIAFNTTGFKHLKFKSDKVATIAFRTICAAQIVKSCPASFNIISNRARNLEDETL